ncbi:hydroxymethylglutaryl-CoA lyase [Siculibacillus lacustris]|uniref:hydroxymethylglutaryl-CoA lyase n=1 Tax=Siculibacillus lacustris TaxID=1549641 RepID=A0A4Q9VN33_9HYPH|nr:hydroxymethylglutaryl-CoA lyase [Siculibacillus lacustris]TBW36795.1 hydroxymethylglutaryl-CoA lyase [Siculibacillus lacustris]
MTFPKHVRIVEVGPRDGLQNEAARIDTATRIDLVERLIAAGLESIEVGSFVSPKWVPQMADSAEVLAAVVGRPGVSFPVLVPNDKGLAAALAAGAREVAVFAAASEAFSQKNLNCSIDESLARFAPVMATARDRGVRVRGYVSCVLGCPYQGEVPVADVVRVARRLIDMGCYEVSLGDTVGVGTASAAARMVAAVAAEIPIERIALHFHDTYGQALANTLACLDLGVAVIDASVGGLGGCPYAAGASGNLATEDLVYMLNGLGIDTGVDLDRLIGAAQFISAALGRPVASRVGRALGDRVARAG